MYQHQVEAIEAARAGDNYVLTTGTGSGKSLFAPPLLLHGATTAGRSSPLPRVTDRYDVHQLVRLVRWIESDTLLRTRDELFWDTLKALGFERAGSKITPALLAAISVARGPHTNPLAEPSPPAAPPVLSTPRRAAAPNVTSDAPARQPVTASEPLARRATPTAGELQSEGAVWIRYLPKTGDGSGTERVVNPLHFSGNLMWAWCHKHRGIRCFNIIRISDRHPADPDMWTPRHGEGRR